MENNQIPVEPVDDDAPTANIDATHVTNYSEAKPEVPAKKPLPKWLRLGLIGLGVAAILYFAGFLTDRFVSYQPLKIQNDTAVLQLADLKAQMDSRNSQLIDANNRITGLQLDITSLLGDMDKTKNHVELLAAISEIQAAQIALTNADLSGAKVALILTPQRLEKLKAIVAPLDAVLAENMITRLNMVVDTLDSNPLTARADLAILTENLMDVELLLFK